MRILVDTNVFLDFVLNRDNKGLIAEHFFSLCVNNHHQIMMTSMSLRDIEYLSHKLLHDKKKSKDVQMKAYYLCHKVIGISGDAAIESLYSEVSDYEDSLIAEAAQEEMCDVIVTNNTKDFIKSRVPAFTPLDIIKKTGGINCTSI